MWTSILLHLALSPLVLSAAQQAEPGDSARQSGWMRDWEAEEGFAILLDSDGYSLPAAIAFIPGADTAPDAPLYFVAELRGAIKVVTRNRRVYVFADHLIPRPPVAELPAEQGESGLAGLCLAPGRGYLFATFAYRDSSGTLRNSMVRFTSTPHRYGLRPTAMEVLDAPFAGSRTAPSHQVGPCQVQGNLLYVSVGDGMQMASSQDVRAPLGKILRMTLDARPAPDNPFPNAAGAGPYVWAYGLRNPFSLRVVGDRVIGADNGPGVDRFIDFTAGTNYLWNGSDWSMASNAVTVFAPSPGPVQLDYVAPGSLALPPPYQDRFYLAMAGLPSAKGRPNRPGAKGIVMVDYDLAERRLRSVPRSVLRYRGDDYQVVAALGVGPDGLYFAGLLPGSSGTTPVFKLVHRPDAPHPYLVLEDRGGQELFHGKGCLGCHARGDRRLGQQGPPLDLPDLAERLAQRLDSPEYEQHMAALNTREDEPFARYRASRDDVLSVSGGERVRRWMRYRLQDPQFDDPNATMPDLGLTAGQAEALTEFLLSTPRRPNQGVIARLRAALPRPRYVFIAGAFAGGIAVGAVGLWLLGRRGQPT
jgi:hypothetical protein